jgi:opacity protein-like surface antigen
MRAIWLTLVGLLFLAPGLFAQSPIAAGYSPVFRIGAGYSFANVNVPSRASLNMNGGGITGGLDFNARFGIEGDVSYVRAFSAFGTGHSADLLTYMGGPVFYLRRTKRMNIYTHALFGAARETGVNFDPNGTLLMGFVNGFAWAAGGGAEIKLDRNLSLRMGANYLNTRFFDSTTALKHQNNIQTFVGFSYRFGGHHL